MKKILPIVIFSLLFVKMSAQPTPPHLYVPLAVDSANWIVSYESSAESSPYQYNVYSVVGDTNVANTDYKKIYLTQLSRVSQTPPQYSVGNTQLFAFVRDSFQVASVFAMHPTAGFLCEPNSNTEYLLYDFSVLKTDTLNNCLTNNTDYIVDSTYLQFESAKSRRFYVNNNSSMYFIEGIGSTRGLFEPNFDLTNDTTSSNEYCYGTLASCISVALTTEELAFSKLSIYPNPTSSNILVKGLDENYSGFIVNSFGQLVKSIASFSTEINLSGLPKGVYFLRIYHAKNNESTMKKIIVY